MFANQQQVTRKLSWLDEEGHLNEGNLTVEKQTNVF